MRNISIFLFPLAIYLTGCNGSSVGSPGTNNSLAVSAPPTSLSYRTATPDECVSGGGAYSLYIDQNGNGLLDAGEVVLNTQIVCNGAKGSDGLTTLFSAIRVNVDLNACASGRGLQVSYGPDSDRDGQLEAGEISQTQVLCDGQDGAAGAAGPAGADGLNAVFQVTAADPSVCANGGSTILMALDSQHSGIYSALDLGQQAMTICNGQNGAAAITPAYAPVEAIMPCGNTVAYKEVLLRLYDGQILASFSDNASGANTRLSFLPDGSYVDTDNSGCNFFVSTSADGLSRSISWSGQVQETWSVSP